MTRTHLKIVTLTLFFIQLSAVAQENYRDKYVDKGYLSPGEIPQNHFRAEDDYWSPGEVRPMTPAPRRKDFDEISPGEIPSYHRRILPPQVRVRTIRKNKLLVAPAAPPGCQFLPTPPVPKEISKEMQKLVLAVPKLLPPPPLPPVEKFQDLFTAPDLAAQRKIMNGLHHQLAHAGPIKSCSLIGGKHSYQAMLVTFGNGTKGVFKPEERTYASYKHEILSFELSQFLEFYRVPPTISYTLSPEPQEGDGTVEQCLKLLGKSKTMTTGSLQLYLSNTESGGQHHFSLPKNYKSPKASYYEDHLKSRELRVFDFLQFNCDRHGTQNLLFLDGREIWIDNGMGFMSLSTLESIRSQGGKLANYCETMHTLATDPAKLSKEVRCRFAPPAATVSKLQTLTSLHPFIRGFAEAVKGDREKITNLLERKELLLKLAAECRKVSTPLDPLEEVALSSIPYGPRSLRMIEHLKGEGGPLIDIDLRTVLVKGTPYEVLTGKTRNLSARPVLSAGLDPFGREMILLDPQKSPLVEAFYLDFRTKVLTLWPLKEGDARPDPAAIFNYLSSYMNEAIFFQKGSLVQKLEQFIRDWETDKIRRREDFFESRKNSGRPLIPMDDFIGKGIGVCRHHSLLAAYFLDRLLKDAPRLLPKGSVFHNRQELEEVGRGGHAWFVFASEEGDGRLWHIDTLWSRVGDVSNESERKKLAQAGYGEKVLLNEWNRFGITPKAKKE